jgi:hypothetical protein
MAWHQVFLKDVDWEDRYLDEERKKLTGENQVVLDPVFHLKLSIFSVHERKCMVQTHAHV